MDRQMVYPGSLPQDTDFLLTNKNAMVALAKLTEAIFGTSTLVSGLACTPTGPAGMTVNVSGGSIYAQEEVDPTAYGSIIADTVNLVVKQGIILTTTNFSCPAPVTTGQSVVYLVQAAFSEVDGGSTVLPYYNASNPAAPYNGPNNTGTSNNTVRQDKCVLTLKTGTPATTGSQVAPTADAGSVPLWTITVANGQSSITSGSIAVAASAPFILETLTQKISQATGDARYLLAGGASTIPAYGLTTNSTNAYSVTTTPVVTALTAGQIFSIKFNAANTGAATLNVGASGAVGIIDRGGSAFVGGELVANRTYPLVYNGTNLQLLVSIYPENSYGATAGSSNVYTVTTVPSFGILKTGQVVNVNFNAANTAGITLNPNSIGAIAVHDTDGNALQAGHIVANRDYRLFYDGASLIVSDPYPGIRQNSQSAAYTTVMADNGGQIYHPASDNNARTFTIDSNTNVAYPIGATITFINDAATSSTIAITSDTLELAGSGTTGSRTLAQYGIATAIKKAATAWMISGTGLS